MSVSNIGEVVVTRSGLNNPDFTNDEFVKVKDVVNGVLEQNGFFDTKFYARNIKWEKSPYDRMSDCYVAETVTDMFTKMGKSKEFEGLLDKTMNLENQGVLSINLASDTLTTSERRKLQLEILEAVNNQFPSFKSEGMHVQCATYGNVKIGNDMMKNSGHPVSQL